MQFWRFNLAAALLFAIVGAASTFAQGLPGSSEFDSLGRQASVAPRPRKHFCFEQKDKARLALKQLPVNARSWLDEDAAYIISPEERCAFLHLQTDEEREHFVEQFWYRRSVDPDSPDDDFKVEHYRRIAFANENYADSFAEGGGIAGWKMDRGRIYVLFGTPDSVEVSSSRRVSAAVAGQRSEGLCRSEKWHYQHLQGIGETPGMDLDFAACRGNAYRLVIPEGNEPPFVDAITRNVLRNSPRSDAKNSSNIQIYVGAVPSPKVTFKDLEAMVVSRFVRDEVKFSHTIDFAKATQVTTLVRIHIRITRTGLGSDGDLPSAQYQLLVRVSKTSGRVMDTSELTVDQATQDKLDSTFGLDARFNVPLPPGRYQLAVTAKNVANGDVGIERTTLVVPTYETLELPKHSGPSDEAGNKKRQPL